MALAAIPTYNFPIAPGSIFDLIFHQTTLTIKVLGFPPEGYSINLIGLLILIILAIAVNAIAERLTSKKVGGLFAAVLITIIGSYLCSAYVKLPFDFAVENVRIIAAFIGATIIAVFYVLIKGQVSKK